MPVQTIPTIPKSLIKKFTQDMRFIMSGKKESPAQRRRRILRERKTSAERRKITLTPMQRKTAKKVLAEAYAVDIACGMEPVQLFTYAHEHPNRFFVGVEDIAIKRIFYKGFAQMPNVRVLKMDAREALDLLAPNSKRLLNMSNFPHFESGVERLAPFRKQIFAKAFKALAPGGTLALTTTQMPLAQKELAEAGFKLGKPRMWGEGKLNLKYASRHTMVMTTRVLRARPELILAKKPRAP